MTLINPRRRKEFAASWRLAARGNTSSTFAPDQRAAEYANISNLSCETRNYTATN